MPQTRTCRYFPFSRALSGAVAYAFSAWMALDAQAGFASEGPRRDTLELPAVWAERPAPPPPIAAKTVIIPTDEDRQLGNLGDMLQRAAGIHVVRTGGLGDYLGVSVWGSSEHQVNVYVNGVLRNQANDASLFLGDWDLSRVERIEVYKGLAPDHLPGSPMGGSINIVTREAALGSGGRIALGAGSFGSLRANGAVEYRQRGWRGRFEAARNQAEGDFPYYDDNGTEFKPGRHPDGAPRLAEGDLTRKIRRNNAHAYSQAAADLTFSAASGLETGAQFDASRLRKQIPANAANIDSTVAVTSFRESDRMFLRGFSKWSGADAEASFDLSGTHLMDAYVDTSTGGGAIGVGYDNDRNTYTDMLATLWGRRKIAGGFSLSALVAYGVSGYLFTDVLRDKDHPRLFRYTGEGKLTPAYASGRHAVQAMLATTFTLQEQYGDREYTYGGFIVPREDWDRHGSLRLGYQYLFRDGLWMSAQGGTAYRIPTFLEQFGDRGSVLANPALRPESGLNGSLGLHAASRRYSAELQGFATQGEDIITLAQNSQSVLVYRNTDATRIFGLECRLAASPRPWTRSEVDLTLQKAVNLDGAPGIGGYKLIPYRPSSQASLRQSLMRSGWTLAATGYYQGLAYPNASNQASLFDSYSHSTGWQARCDLDISWRVKHLLLAAGVRNLFDQNNFDFFNFPHPGRNFAATVQAEL